MLRKNTNGFSKEALDKWNQQRSEQKQQELEQQNNILRQNLIEEKRNTPIQYSPPPPSKWDTFKDEFTTQIKEKAMDTLIPGRQLLKDYVVPQVRDVVNKYNEWDSKQPRLKEIDDSFVPVLPEFLGGGQLPFKYDPTPSRADQAKTVLTGLNEFANSATLGIKPLIEKDLAPDYYQWTQKKKAESPIASGIGNLAGYIVPGMGQAKAAKALWNSRALLPMVSKITPYVSKYLPGTDIVGQMARWGLGGAAEGATMGSIVGATEASLNDKPIIEGALQGAKDWSLQGAVLGGGIGGVKSIWNKMPLRAPNITPNIPSTNVANLNIPRFGETVGNEILPQLNNRIGINRDLNMPNITPPRVNPSENFYNALMSDYDNIYGNEFRPVTEIPQQVQTPRQTQVPRQREFNMENINETNFEPVNLDYGTQSSVSDPKTFRQRMSEGWNNFKNNAVDFSDDYAVIKQMGNKDKKVLSDVDRIYKVADNTNTLYGQKDVLKTDTFVDRNGIPVKNAKDEEIPALLNIFTKDGKTLTQEEFNAITQYKTAKHNVDRIYNEKPIFESDIIPGKPKVEGTIRFDPIKYEKEMKWKMDLEARAQQYKDEALRLEKQYPWVKKMNDNINDFETAIGEKWLVDGDLVSKDLYKTLRETYPEYFNVQKYIDPLDVNKVRTNRGTNTDLNVIETAEGGAKQILPIYESMNKRVNTITKNVHDNAIRKAIYEKAVNEPGILDNYVQIIDKKPLGSNINDAIHVMDDMTAPQVDVKIKPNDAILEVYIKGEKYRMLIKDQRLWDAFTAKRNIDFEIPGVTAGAKWLNNLIKSGATQYNPVFALKNFAKDLNTAYLNGVERNPIKFLNDYKKAYLGKANNTLKRAGMDFKEYEAMYKQYKRLGGQNSGFYKSLEDTTGDEWKALYDNLRDAKGNQLFPTQDKKVAKWLKDNVKDLVGYSEDLPRVMEFSKVLKKTGDVQEALYAANNITTNFARSGYGTRFLNTYFPYSNAGIQSVKTNFDSVKRNPWGYSGKYLATIGLGKVASELWSRMNDNEKYAAIDQRIKDENFVFMKEDGSYFKIPITRDSTVAIATIAQRALANYLDGKDNLKSKDLLDMIAKLSPVNPISGSVFGPVTGVVTNYNWAGEKIVSDSMARKENKDQYTDKTNDIAKFLGEKLDISPLNIDYLLKSYGTLFESIENSAVKSYSEGKDSDKAIEDTLYDITKKAIKSIYADANTQNYDEIGQFYDNLKSIERKVNSEKIELKLPPNVKKFKSENTEELKYWNKMQKEISDLQKEANEEKDPQKKKLINTEILNIAKIANKSIKK